MRDVGLFRLGHAKGGDKNKVQPARKIEKVYRVLGWAASRETRREDPELIYLRI
jgi:hypothetical protein